MAGHFEPLPGGGAAVALDEVEISILRSLAVQLLELIGPGESQGPDEADPLARLFAEGPSEPPADPALARLFPDAYGDPGAEQDRRERAYASEFRRYTENDLRARKREDALGVVGSLDTLSPAGGGGAVLRLAPEECRRWLGALNDLRLAIGTRLEVREDDDTEELFRLPDEDPRKPMVMAYLWLGGLQETLIEAMTG
ncbi:DUF2017 domain-containing protein [Streptomyces albireticuli]|uniref:Uncharacterized protein n=1 Tax=Streptomyces albireticuli TaxID=1940 RepID=A0A2A2DCP4_9ACTN|nr:DUF2017 domain-containing protein [Streptomyces albireticuli]MCD9141520.1 DUF2017 domain-containing protein [Streptomyces albireticuli]MCD9164229.1 DUF2017 domain-containing protein [Streptomyces albireticuli]MCD9189694.1 DUF2017 domain-containing protein [Streptomyces albireticuli]PAU49120.1 hypothetical protein CK936_09620 [Streptomyces albireticuli]